MIIEAKTVSSNETVEADLCIVGAGPAGLTIARHFLGTEHRVYVLESGGDHLDESARALADGDVVGHPYFPLSEARARVVGGSSYLWEEWMRARPLDPIDFEARTWIPSSGWPFGRDELEAYYGEAHQLLGLGAYDYVADGVEEWEQARQRSQRGVEPAVFKYSNTFDFEQIRRDIDKSANICLMLNATVLELESSDDGQRVERAVVSSENPQRFSIDSRVFILAAGGVDNARILLLSRSQSQGGLANGSGLVGKHFMEHPTVRRGTIVSTNGMNNNVQNFFRMRLQGQQSIRGALVPTAEMMRQKSILNGMVLLTESDEISSSETLRSVAMVRDSLRGENTSGESGARHLLNALSRPRHLGRVLWRNATGSQASPERLRISVTVEQAPSPLSRVVMGKRLDRFGQPFPVLDWRLGEDERRTVRVLQESVDAWARDLGLGHVEGFLGDESPPRVFRGEWHQLGTTRMASTPKAGVVDSDGRAHDIANLYIAGGSVFPTVGYANPTLTIVALCLRLTKQLDKALGRGMSLGPIW